MIMIYVLMNIYVIKKYVFFNRFFIHVNNRNKKYMFVYVYFF